MGYMLGVCKGAQRYTEMHGCVQRCVEVHAEVCTGMHEGAQTDAKRWRGGGILSLLDISLFVRNKNYVVTDSITKQMLGQRILR